MIDNINKILRTLKKVLLTIIILPIALAFYPIKISKVSTDFIRSEKYYILYQISLGSTEGGCWVCYDQDDVGYSISEFEGELPQNMLAQDVYNVGTTKFVVYGYIIKNSEEEIILHINGWDLVGNINRDCDSLRINFKRIITIYDLKWTESWLSSNEPKR